MDILCNVRTCRRPLQDSLWVTRCSHSFCKDHANALLANKDVKCPACNTVLGKRYDVIKQNAHPGAEFRAMYLVGLRPEIVLEIATHAMTFWNYQMRMELKYQNNSAKYFKEAVEKIKDNQAKIMKQLISEKKTNEAQEKVIVELRNNIKFLKDELILKEDQLQKMQLALYSMKNKLTHTEIGIQDDTTVKHSDHWENNNDTYPRFQGAACDESTCAISSINQPDFVFKPLIAPRKKEL